MSQEMMAPSQLPDANVLPSELKAKLLPPSRCPGPEAGVRLKEERVIGRLRPEKLHVGLAEGSIADGPVTPRCYTLTHSDSGRLAVVPHEDLERCMPLEIYHD